MERDRAYNKNPIIISIRQTDRQTDRQADRQTDGQQTDRLTDRQTDRQTTVILISIYIPNLA
jgi:hypothetical protein